MGTSSTTTPCGVTGWGGAGNCPAVSWEGRCPALRHPSVEGSQRSRRQDHGKFTCPHLEISVMYLQKMYLYFELFQSSHLFSSSVSGKALFKLCKTNLVCNVLELPGCVLVKWGTAFKQRHLFPLFWSVQQFTRKNTCHCFQNLSLTQVLSKWKGDDYFTKQIWYLQNKLSRRLPLFIWCSSAAVSIN